MAVTTGQGLRLVAARRKVAELATKWPAKRINAILYGTTVLYNLEKNVMYMILPFPFRENVF